MKRLLDDPDGLLAQYVPCSRIRPSSSAYTSQPIAAAIDWALADAKVASWNGVLPAWAPAPYPSDVTALVLAVLAHPDHRAELRQLVAQIEAQFPAED